MELQALGEGRDACADGMAGGTDNCADAVAGGTDKQHGVGAGAGAGADGWRLVQGVCDGAGVGVQVRVAQRRTHVAETVELRMVIVALGPVDDGAPAAGRAQGGRADHVAGSAGGGVAAAEGGAVVFGSRHPARALGGREQVGQALGQEVLLERKGALGVGSAGGAGGLGLGLGGLAAAQAVEAVEHRLRAAVAGRIHLVAAGSGRVQDALSKGAVAQLGGPRQLGAVVVAKGRAAQRADRGLAPDAVGQRRGRRIDAEGVGHRRGERAVLGKVAVVVAVDGRRQGGVERTQRPLRGAEGSDGQPVRVGLGGRRGVAGRAELGVGQRGRQRLVGHLRDRLAGKCGEVVGGAERVVRAVVSADIAGVGLHQRVVQGRAVAGEAGVHAAKVEATGQIWAVDTAAVREDVGESAFCSKLAVSLPQRIRPGKDKEQEKQKKAEKSRGKKKEKKTKKYRKRQKEKNKKTEIEGNTEKNAGGNREMEANRGEHREEEKSTEKEKTFEKYLHGAASLEGSMLWENGQVLPA